MIGSEPGRIIAGRYQLLRQIREGSNAAVWEALDQQREQLVAVKCSADVSRLRSERDVLRQLDHPAIVAMLDWVGDDADAALVLEHIDGPELRDFMGAPSARWIPYLRPVLDALRYLQRRGLAHNDLSLHNIVVDGGRGRLLDFGLAAAGPGKPDVQALGVILQQLDSGTSGRAKARHPLLEELIDELTGNNPALTLSEIGATLDRVVTEPTSQEKFDKITPVGRNDAPATEAPANTGRWAIRAVVLIGALAILVLAFTVPGWLNPGEGRLSAAADGAESEATARLQSLTTEFDDLRTNPAGQIERIIDHLGIEPNDEQIASAVGHVVERTSVTA